MIAFLLACTGEEIPLDDPEVLLGTWHAQLAPVSDDAPWRDLLFSVWADAGDVRYALDRDGIALGTPDADGIERGYLVATDDAFTLVTDAGDRSELTVLERSDTTLVVTGPAGSDELTFRARERCEAPGRWREVDGPGRYADQGFVSHAAPVLWTPDGTLFVGGSSLRHQPARNCGLVPLVDLAANALVNTPDGRVAALDWREDGGLFVHELDPATGDVLDVADLTGSLPPATWREEVISGQRADGTPVFLTSGGGRVVERTGPGRWTVWAGPDDGGLRSTGLRVASHPDGRLLLSPGWAKPWSIETAPGSRVLEPFVVEDARDGRPGDHLRVLYDYADDGTLWAAWSQWPALPTPDGSFEYAVDDALWVGRLREGSWERFSLGTGNAFELDVTDDEIRVASLQHRRSRVHAFTVLDHDGNRVRSGFTGPLPDPVQGTVNYDVIRDTAEAQTYPEAAFGPGEQVAFRGVMWTHGYAGARTHPVELAVDTDRIAEVRVGDTVCTGSCSVDLVDQTLVPIELEAGPHTATLEGDGLHPDLGIRPAEPGSVLTVERAERVALAAGAEHEILQDPQPLHDLAEDGVVTGAVAMGDGFLVALRQTITLCGEPGAGATLVQLDGDGAEVDVQCLPGVHPGSLLATASGPLLEVSSPFGGLPGGGSATQGWVRIQTDSIGPFGWERPAGAARLDTVVDDDTLIELLDDAGVQLVRYDPTGALVSTVPLSSVPAQGAHDLTLLDGDAVVLAAGQISRFDSAGQALWSLGAPFDSVIAHEDELVALGTGGTVLGQDLGALRWIARISADGALLEVNPFPAGTVLGPLTLVGDDLFTSTTSSVQGRFARVETDGTLHSARYSVSVAGLASQTYPRVDAFVVGDGEDARLFTTYIGGYESAGWWADFGTGRLLPTPWPTAWTGRFVTP